ncbi:MAG TPA: hypothetical protein VF753_05835 [Terriglobales bacterium]
MACPFFMPTSRFDDGGWIHPSRLPLGAGWKGHCCAPGHEGVEPEADELREWCNMGYASGCGRRPKENSNDAVRFAVTRDSASQVNILYSIETAHLPAGHGTLEYDLAGQRFTTSLADARILKMAECFLQSHLARRASPNPGNSPSTSS